MRLDQTNVRIRERSILEIFDLAVQVLRVHWRPWLILTMAGALPLAILNDYLSQWMLEPFVMELASGSPFFYMWNQLLLVMIEAPLASLLLTSYLGHAVFDETPSLWVIFRDSLRKWLMLFWSVFLLRGVVLIWLINIGAMQDGGEFAPWRVVALCLLLFWVFALRCFRPFIIEIIVLEQPAWRSRPNQTVTLRQRSGQMHRANAQILFGRSVLMVLLTIGIGWMLFGGLATVAGFVDNNWFPRAMQMRVVFPLSLWLVVGFMVVVRFLSYLDMRIRQEGWEVELLIRAEGEKVMERLV